MKALIKNSTLSIAITRCVPSPVSEIIDQKLYIAANESLFCSSEESAYP